MRVLPRDVRPYLYLMRLDRPIGWWLLLLPGWWGIALGSWMLTSWSIVAFALFLIGAVIMRAAGCIINDIWDRDLDKQVERTAKRPLASGVISLFDALVLLTLLLMSGLAILILMPPLTVALGFLSIPLIAIYPFMKRITWWPQLFLGIVFNFGVLMGFAAATETLTFGALLLYIGAIFWTLAYDTVYAHQDIEDDLRVGIKSTARLFGEKSKLFVSICYALAFLFLLGAMIETEISPAIYALLIPAVGYTIRGVKDWDPADQASSLVLFKANRDIGLLVFGALFCSLFI